MARQPSHPSRRRFVAASAVALPALLTAAEQPASRPAPAKNLNVVCVGAHPDDPESGCGGTLARYAAAGHHVTVIYLTRGEAGIPGKSQEEAAKVRTAEAEEARKILGAKPVFAGQIDGATEVNRDKTQALHKLLSDAAPHVVFTHWPLDTHPDHQAASLLTLRAYLAFSRRF